MKKNTIDSRNETVVLCEKDNVLEAVDLFSRLSPDLQDAIIDLVKTMIQPKTSNK